MSAKHAANGTTDSTKDPIVEASDDLAQLVDRVVEGHRPILVARAGEPKAALVSMEDYARLREESAKATGQLSQAEWSRRASKLGEEILASRGGRPIDLDELISDMHDDLEERDAHNRGD